MNCRLPQTPRTPAAAATHYFDDVFTRQRRKSLSGTRRNSLARSLTRTRSIGARSDWTNGGDKTPAPPSAAGDDDNNEDGDGDDEAATGEERKSRQYSIYKEDPNEAAGKGESSDDHITKYVQEQLQRLKTNESNEFSEEIAATGNGAGEDRNP
jgi:hypothetical protein